MREFYTTTAQVLPVLMLAFLWESRFLIKLRTEVRPPKRVDRVSGVLFWSKTRVRYFLITVATTTVLGTATSVLTLSGILPDSVLLRTVVSGCVLLALGTLLTRVVIDITDATTLTTADKSALIQTASSE
jgi:hypothetical protein